MASPRELVEGVAFVATTHVEGNSDDQAAGAARYDAWPEPPTLANEPP